jgi:hypothetical protein
MTTNRLTERELTARAMTDIKTSNNGLTERELTAVELEDVSGGGKTLTARAKIVDGRFEVSPHL